MSRSAASVDLCGLRLTVLDGGTFRLDGAALYGILPRVYWEKLNHPDEDNRVLLSVAPMVVETPEGVFLIDPGLGSQWGAAARDRFDLKDQRPLETMLAEAGVTPAQVVGVILTHLHFDHAWGAVHPLAAREASGGSGWVDDLSGDLETALPSARLYVQREEIAAARHPDLRTAGHVVPSVVTAYEQAGRLELIEGSVEPAPGLRIEKTGGHTAGHQVVWLEGQEAVFLLPGDLVPTATHLRGEVVEGLDHTPVVSAAVRAGLLARAVESNAWLTFYHAPRVRWGRIRSGPSGAYKLDETHTVSPASRRERDRSRSVPPQEAEHE